MYIHVMRHVIFLFLFAFSTSLVVNAKDIPSAQSCAEKIGTCEYYNCLEERESCGSNGYYLKFAAHYCRKYQEKQNKYTDRGQEFLTSIRTCLQDELERERIHSNELPSCSKIENFAIETHKYCYQKSNFCGLPLQDQIRVKLTAKKEIIHIDMIKFGLWLEKSCDN
ncbi:hypothetical protein CIK05_13240 [Bdellovibrio sp. qaytius]|nr:hypothetical protein CIK05_13240 [Bdellovibrio sp. qaytius]